MRINLSPVKQVIAGYYYRGLEDHIKPESITPEQLQEELKGSINDSVGIPGTSGSRVIARAVRLLDQSERTKLVNELVPLLLSSTPNLRHQF